MKKYNLKKNEKVKYSFFIGKMFRIRSVKPCLQKPIGKQHVLEIINTVNLKEIFSGILTTKHAKKRNTRTQRV